jgi:two-component SAPR family response regulator
LYEFLCISLSIDEVTQVYNSIKMKGKNNNNYYNSLNAFNAHYLKFIQFSIKKGKKHTVEKLYNKLLFNVAKKHKFF